MGHRGLSLRVGLVDATAVTALWSQPFLLPFLFDVAHSYAEMMELAPLFLGVFALVAWRGSRHATRFINSQASATSAIAEGTIVFTAAAVIAVMLVDVNLDKGTFNLNLSFEHIYDRLGLGIAMLMSGFLTGPIAASAVVGALHGAVLHELNTYLIAKWLPSAA